MNFRSQREGKNLSFSASGASIFRLSDRIFPDIAKGRGQRAEGRREEIDR
ncbi:MAG: hypothetical protein F6K21_23790 [Symploca sp. SIO2D2]|nr:hypothetical protein [Symploca sp. SIO2D2]